MPPYQYRTTRRKAATKKSPRSLVFSSTPASAAWSFGQYCGERRKRGKSFFQYWSSTVGKAKPKKNEGTALSFVL